VKSEVASALAYLHARKIVHHDVKLENILIRERRGYRSAVLSDLGLCTAAPTVTDWGTPGWRAPQVVRNESHGTGADIWSLGIVLFALWSGNDLGDMLTAGGVTKKEFRILLDGACVEGPLPCWFEADVFQSSQFGLDGESRMP
jgi:serine/threonine protein kinase